MTDGVVARVAVRARDEVADAGVAVVPERLVEARDRAERRAGLEHALDLHLRGLRDLLVGRLAAELERQGELRARRPPLDLHDVHRHADRPRAVLDPALHRLPDPPRRIGRELESSAPVELLDRAHEPEHAFLDEVEERQPLAAVALRDRDDEAQVRVDHPLLRGRVSPLDALRELDLLRRGQERVAADVVEEELERVRGRRGLESRRGRAPSASSARRRRSSSSARRHELVGVGLSERLELVEVDGALALRRSRPRRPRPEAPAHLASACTCREVRCTAETARRFASGGLG